MGDGIEREVKLDVEADFAVPPLDRDGTVVVEVLESHQLDATYHDAGDLRLLGLGITVRRRTGEGTRWTVKFPTAELAAAGGLARREVDVVTDSVTPPAAVIELVAPHLAGAPLAPVARLVSRRDRLALSSPDGRALAELDDDRVTVDDPTDRAGGGDGLGVGRLAFRELELEFGPEADPQLIGSVVSRLLEAGATRTSIGSKVEHALALLGRVLDGSG
jgi:inorganic triphosphatase YgiF